MSVVTRLYSIRARAIPIHGQQRQRAPNATIVAFGQRRLSQTARISAHGNRFAGSRPRFLNSLPLPDLETICRIPIG